MSHAGTEPASRPLTAQGRVQDDHGTVTCVGPLDTGNPTPNALMSGAKDGTITIWDLRINTPAMRMTAAEGPSASAMVQSPFFFCPDREYTGRTKLLIG